MIKIVLESGEDAISGGCFFAKVRGKVSREARRLGDISGMGWLLYAYCSCGVVWGMRGAGPGEMVRRGGDHWFGSWLVGGLSVDVGR